jgi:hypothetical protein
MEAILKQQEGPDIGDEPLLLFCGMSVIFVVAVTFPVTSSTAPIQSETVSALEYHSAIGQPCFSMVDIFPTARSAAKSTNSR